MVADAKTIIEQYQGLIFSVCKRKLDNITFMEDAIQSVYLLFYEKGIFENRDEYSSWFYWASVNACNYINKNEKKLALIKNEKTMNTLRKEDDEKEDEELYSEIELELKKVSKKNLQLILWYFFEKKTYLEIATILNSTEDGIRMRLKRLTAEMGQNIGKRKKAFDLSHLALFFNCSSKIDLTSAVGLNINIESLMVSKKILLIKKGVSNMILISKLKMIGLPLILLSTAGISTYAYDKGFFNSSKNNPIIGKEISKEKSNNQENVSPVAEKTVIYEWLESMVFFEFNNKGVKDVIKELGTLSNVKFTFNNEITVDLNKIIAQKANGISLKKALENILTPLKLTYKITKDREIEIINMPEQEVNKTK